MGLIRSALAHLGNRLNPVTMVREALAAFPDKIIPQGAAEIGQALFAGGNPYTPYGPTERPLPMTEAQPVQAPVAEPVAAHAPAMEAPQAAPVAPAPQVEAVAKEPPVQEAKAGPQHGDYNQMLQGHIARHKAQEQQQDKGMER